LGGRLAPQPHAGERRGRSAIVDESLQQHGRVGEYLTAPQFTGSDPRHAARRCHAGRARRLANISAVSTSATAATAAGSPDEPDVQSSIGARAWSVAARGLDARRRRRRQPAPPTRRLMGKFGRGCAGVGRPGEDPGGARATVPAARISASASRTFRTRPNGRRPLRHGAGGSASYGPCRTGTRCSRPARMPSSSAGPATPSGRVPLEPLPPAPSWGRAERV
jgi:hypothetical protein